MILEKEENIGYWCKHVMIGFKQELDERTRHLKLAAPVSMLIIVLYKHGSSSLVELARFLEHAHPSVLRHLDELEKSGYAIRIPHPQDRRKKIIQLTDKGHTVAPELIRILQEIHTQATSGISRTDIETILKGLKQMTVNLGSGPESLLLGKHPCCDFDHQCPTDQNLNQDNQSND